MHLYTQTLNTVTGLLANEGSFGLNLDIFEANLINIVILGGGIFKLGSTALSESLAERQQKIVGAIQESEEKLQDTMEKISNLEQEYLILIEEEESLKSK